MDTSIFPTLIAQSLQLNPEAVRNTLSLLDEGCTIPFISRYRKERTGSLDEVQIAAISDEYERLKETAKRKETVLKTIAEQGKLMPDLEARIAACWNQTELEDIYLPFRPRRRTRAQVAREQGLEPLAQLIMLQREQNVEQAARKYVSGDVADVEAALKGAQDIIAETISEDEHSRQQLRGSYRRTAIITSKVVKAKADSDEAAKYSDYFDWHEPLKRCSSHRLLAMRRGEAEGILRLSIDPIDDEECISRLKHQWVRSSGTCARLLAEAAEDSYKRLLKPSIETEFGNLSKKQADDDAISVFAENLRQLLLGAPLGQKRVMGIDPGFRTGCKVVCLDAQGNLLHHEAIFPHPPVNRRMQAAAHLSQMIEEYGIEAIAIGN
ncbi:MAG: RNA-binding transcriptional accessory protein, partial [Prevotella sp.]|nr:RNA-binding transcriptional accessory protein [Prevotella sp.]